MYNRKKNSAMAKKNLSNMWEKTTLIFTWNNKVESQDVKQTFWFLSFLHSEEVVVSPCPLLHWKSVTENSIIYASAMFPDLLLVNFGQVLTKIGRLWFLKKIFKQSR